MTKDSIIKILHLWQFRLGLTDWQIAVVFDDSNPTANGHSCHMKIHRSTYYKRATLTIGSSALDYNILPDCIEKDLIQTNIVEPITYVETSIVHELLHLAFRDLVCVAEMVDEQLHPAVREVLSEAHTRAEEQVVEHLAISLVTNWHVDN